MLEILDQEMEKDRNLIAAARDEASTIDRCSPPPETGACNHDIPGYELVRRIGGGGQGTVYEAVQSSTGRRVALKVIRSDRASSSRWRRFEREVRLLARLQHAHIVTVYDSGHTDDCLYFAMELVDGQRFNEYVHHAGLDRRRSLTVFAEVCDAVHAAHQRGVMHRDLKPANILVDDAGVPHVLDFGLAKLILESDDETRSDAALTQDGQFLGTIGWASPEQVQGDPEDVDIRTDVYSLGVILFELLTGIPPYDTNRPLREAIDNIIHVQPERPSTLDRAIDDDLETIALRCLAKEPDRRYGSVGELASDLRRYLTGEPIEAKRDSRLYVLRKTLFRHRVIVAIATTALLFGLGFGVVMTGLYQDARQAREDAEVEITILREEIQELKAELVDPANWTSAFHTARALGKLSPTEGWTLLKSAWDEMTEDDPKQQLLKAANVAQPPYLPRVLHLGMTDRRRSRAGRSTACAVSRSWILPTTSRLISAGMRPMESNRSMPCSRRIFARLSSGCARATRPRAVRCCNESTQNGH